MGYLTLESLNHDVLQQICFWAGEKPHHPKNGADLISSPLDGLSRTSRRLRDISMAVLFRKITVSGDWTLAIKRLEEMGKKSAVSYYVRYNVCLMP